MTMLDLWRAVWAGQPGSAARLQRALDELRGSDAVAYQKAVRYLIETCETVRREARESGVGRLG